MCNTKADDKANEQKYKLVPPDGGWGYVVLISLITYNLIIVEQCATFGLVYGDFLASIGDETSQTAVITDTFFTVQCLTGVISNFLLRRFSLRQLGLAGACIHVLGTFLTIFVQNFPQMLIYYSILEGIGGGLMLSVIFSSFSSYFCKRANLMMGIAQTTSLMGVMVAPLVVNFIMKNLGFRNTLGVMTGISLLNVAGMGFLDPVEKHMKKVLVEEDDFAIDDPPKKKVTVNVMIQNEPLLEEENVTETLTKDTAFYASLEHLGQTTISLGHLNQTVKKERLLEFRLLKYPKLLNMCFGLGFSLIADITSDALIPSVLQPFGYTSSEIAFMMTVCFGADLASRILFSIISIFFSFKNRLLFIAGNLLMAVFRTAFIINYSYTWTVVTLGLYGIARCIIKTTSLLVIAEEYKENFKFAFSWAMVITGIISLIFGGLTSLIKTTTQNDKMVVHLLSMANMFCVICLSVELIYKRIKLKSSGL